MATVDNCAIPVQDAPPGHTSNLTDPDDLCLSIMVSAIILTSIALIFLVGRIFVNWKRLALADYLTLLGFGLSAGFAAIIINLRKYSRHMWDTPVCWYMSEESWKLTFAANMLSAASQLTVKIAILALYFQIFGIKREMRHAIIVTTVLGVIFLLPHPILVIIFEAPRAGQTWTDPGIDGTAAKMEYYGPIRAVASTALDIAILVLPFKVLRTLNVSRRKKLQLGAVFTTGFLGVAASIVSIYWNFRLLLDKPGDQSWQEYQIFIWLMVEEMIGVTVGCMPAFAALIRLYKPKGLGTFFDKTYTDGYRQRSVSKAGLNPVQPESYNIGNQRKERRPRDYYYELDDSILNTQATVTVINPDPTPFATYHQPGGILRTQVITQESHPYTVHDVA